MTTTFDNATESAERLRALRERAERFVTLADDMAAQSQKDRLVMGEMLRALENANAGLKYAADYLRAFNIPKPLDHVLSASKFSENAIAKAKTILE